MKTNFFCLPVLFSVMKLKESKQTNISDRENFKHSLIKLDNILFPSVSSPYRLVDVF